MPNFNESRIKFLYEAVRLGSVRSAADYLDVAPSVVSRHIAQLESELTIDLIERNRRGIKPTEAGLCILEYYRNHLYHQDLLLDNIQAIKGLQTGIISLAIGEGYVKPVTSILAQFSEKFPLIKLNMSIHGSNDLLRLVSDDEASIGVIFNAHREPKIRIQSSILHPMCLIVPPEHPYHKYRDGVTFDQLQNQRIALASKQLGIRQIIAQVEDESKISLVPTLECNSLSALKDFAICGGMTLLPSFMVQDDVKNGSLITIPVKHHIFEKTESYIVTRVGRQQTNGSSRLLRMLATYLT
jgi:DNA-binding transcriptional LysR family regulator